jgi:hypothetical protein
MKKLLVTFVILFAAISSSFAYNGGDGVPTVYGPGSASKVVSINATTQIELICFLVGPTSATADCVFLGTNVNWVQHLSGSQTLYNYLTGTFTTVNISYQCSAGYGAGLILW